MKKKRSVMEPIHGKNWKKELFRKNTGHYVIFLKVLTKPEECPSLYRMMELVRGHEEKINFARMMYLLSRLEPTEEGPKKEKYRQLSQKMYRWIQSDQDCRQLKTAINLYAYIHRTKGEHRDEN